MLKFSNLPSTTEGVEGKGAGEKHQVISKKEAEEFANAPIFTALVDSFFRTYYGAPSSYPFPINDNIPNSSWYWASNRSLAPLVPQYGLIGAKEGFGSMEYENENSLVLANMNNLVMANMTTPWSAYICGAQRAGKSHTLCRLLENMLSAKSQIGVAPKPLAGMAMYYDREANFSTAKACEMASLCSSGIPVTVLVFPSNVREMTRLYGNLPGLDAGAPKPKVLPLYLKEEQLNITTLFKFLAVDPTAESIPLYMKLIIDVIHTMAMDSPRFEYWKFRQRLSQINWIREPEQDVLEFRLNFVDSIMAPPDKTGSTKPAPASEDIWAFEPGTLTIVDLSDPFCKEGNVYNIFSICLWTFLESQNKCGRVIALDEAHKRYNNTRVLVATEQPTLAPEFMCMTNVIIVHRILSPIWFEFLKKYLAAVIVRDGDNGIFLFGRIQTLRTGEALLFCPTAKIDIQVTQPNNQTTVKSLGSGCIKIMIRKRLVVNGSKSIMASGVPAGPSMSTEVADVSVHDAPTYHAPIDGNALMDNFTGMSMAAPKPEKARARPRVRTHRYAPERDLVRQRKNALHRDDTTSSAPTSHIFTIPSRSESELGAIRNEIKRQTERMIQAMPLPRFTGFAKWQRYKLCWDVENALHLPHGTIADHRPMMAIFSERRLIGELALFANYLRHNKRYNHDIQQPLPSGHPSC